MANDGYQDGISGTEEIVFDIPEGPPEPIYYTSGDTSGECNDRQSTHSEMSQDTNLFNVPDSSLQGSSGLNPEDNVQCQDRSVQLPLSEPVEHEESTVQPHSRDNKPSCTATRTLPQLKADKFLLVDKKEDGETDSTENLNEEMDHCDSEAREFDGYS